MKPIETVVRALSDSHPETAARALEGLPAEDAAKILEVLPASVVGAVVERLIPHAAGEILRRIPQDRTQRLLETMSPRQSALVLQHLEESIREQVLSGMPAEAGRQLRDLMRYPPETAGGIMDLGTVSIPIDLTVQETIAFLRKAPREALHYLYVTDRERRLIGVLGMRDLLLASPRDRIEGMVHRDVKVVPATMDREEVSSIMRESRLMALPVVDEENHLLGVVRHEVAAQVAQEEAFEDMQRLVGAGADERALESVPSVVRRRLPWLAFNLGTACLAATVVGIFEDTIARFTALAVLLPIVAGQGGNTGAQALAVTIRGLAMREIGAGSRRRLLTKEALAGLTNGLSIAFLAAGAIFLWYRKPGLSLVIGLAMIVNMTTAAFTGAAIPLALRALGRDPAQSSSIVMTTVTDVVGFGAFLGFATVLAPMLG
ncbi:MAG: magnesium transporter [Planctomycetes bacterium]|nr:magnesium transporter [Planctomycetota bacterium]